MIIRMEIKGPKLTIEDIEVEMARPFRMKRVLKTLDTLNQLKGMGHCCRLHSPRLRGLVGGRKGCCLCCHY